MANLILYSDQIQNVTDEIDERLVKMLPRRGAVIGYLPSSPDPDRKFFNERVAYYDRLNLKLKYFDPAMHYSMDVIGELVKCDAIHLTGGNTYDFNHWLQKKALISVLKQYARMRGTLIGVSAGSILMTPTLFPSMICGDVCRHGDPDQEGMDLVPFTVVPHFDESPEMTNAILEFGKYFSRPIYALKDETGIIVTRRQIEFVGQTFSVNV